MKRILWITPKWPLPAQDGARRASSELLAELTQQGLEIDLLALVGRDEHVDVAEAKRLLGINEVFVARRAPSITPYYSSWIRFFPLVCRFPLAPLTLISYQRQGVQSVVREVFRSAFLGRSEGEGAERRDWQVIVYDGLHAAGHAMQGGVYRRPTQAKSVVYRAHNCESSLWQQRAKIEFNPFLKLVLYYQACLVKRFERSLLRGVDRVAAVSAEDLQNLRRLAPLIQGKVVPIGVEFKETVEDEEVGEQVCFVGRLDWPPNAEGLKWLLKRVWPKVHAKRPSLRLKIAGSGNSGWLERYLPMAGVDYLGRIDSPLSLYRQSLALLVPLRFGSGTRVKVIEAAAAGRACISTPLGVEGLNFSKEHYFRGESSAEWVDILIRLHKANALDTGQAAYHHLKEPCSRKTAGAVMVGVLGE